MFPQVCCRNVVELYSLAAAAAQWDPACDALRLGIDVNGGVGLPVTVVDVAVFLLGVPELLGQYDRTAGQLESPLLFLFCQIFSGLDTATAPDRLRPPATLDSTHALTVSEYKGQPLMFSRPPVLCLLMN